MEIDKIDMFAGQVRLTALKTDLLPVVTDILRQEYSIVTSEALVAAVANGFSRPSAIPQKSWETLVDSARKSLSPKMLKLMEAPVKPRGVGGVMDLADHKLPPATREMIKKSIQVVSSKEILEGRAFPKKQKGSGV